MQALSAAFINGLSDVIAQKMSSRRARIVWRRTFFLGLWGLMWTGCVDK